MPVGTFAMRLRIKPALAALTVVSFAPLLGIIASVGIASGLGCHVDEGGQHPCLIGGVDIGDALHTAFVSMWLIFLTWPGILICSAAWILVFIRWSLRRLAAIKRPA